MSELTATVMVNGYGYKITRRGHLFEANRLIPGGLSGSGLSPAETLRLLADIAELAKPDRGYEG